VTQREMKSSEESSRKIAEWEILPTIVGSKQVILVKKVLLFVIYALAASYIYFFLKEAGYARLIFIVAICYMAIMVLYQPKYKYIISDEGISVKHFIKKFYGWKHLDSYAKNPTKALFRDMKGRLRSYEFPKIENTYFLIRRKSSSSVVDIFVDAKNTDLIESTLRSRLKEVR
jgi:hypothetical protein